MRSSVFAPAVAMLLALAAPASQAAGPGIITNYAGSGYNAGYGLGGFSGDNGPATDADLNLPAGIAIDAQGNLYIADYSNHRVRKVERSTGIITTVAGNGLLLGSCSATYDNLCGDGGPATQANLLYPTAVALDKAGNLYIADTGNQAIRKVNTAGIISTIAGGGLEDMGFSGDGGPATKAFLDEPKGVAVDSAGNIYIADNGSNRIRRVSASNGVIETIAGGGSGCAGITNPIGDGRPATDATLAGPVGIALDASGNLYIADAGESLIRKVNTKGIISTFAGGNNGQLCAAATDAFGDGCLASGVFLYEANGVAVDQFGGVFIADSRDEIVRRVDPLTGIISRIAGSGAAGFTGTGNPAVDAALDGPFGIAFDPNGNFYFADQGNQVVREVGYAPPTAPPPTFYPTPGIFRAALRVTLTAPIAGSTIYYTTNGETPTASSPEYGGSIPVTETTTVKAVSKLPNPKYGLSPVVVGLYTLASQTSTIIASSANPAKVESNVEFTVTIKHESGTAVPTGLVTLFINGAEYEEDYLNSSGQATFYDSDLAVGTYTITATYPGDTLNLASTGTFRQQITYLGTTPTPVFSVKPATYTEKQYVNISVPGQYATIFYTTNGSTPTVNSPQLSGSIQVTKSETIQAIAVIDNYAPSAVLKGVFTIAAPAPPTFSPVSGTFATAQSVEIRDASQGAYIYYTTNGSVPSRNSQSCYESCSVYVSSSQTIKAFAASTPYVQSALVSATYAIRGVPPTFTPNGGTFASPQPVKIASQLPGAVIYYTTNGKTPTTASTKYTGPVTVGVNETIQAIVTSYSYAPSAPASASFVVTGADFFSDGIIETIGGQPGSPGFAGDGGPFANARLNSPTDIAFDDKGNLYIAELYNNDIRKVTPAGEISTVAGKERLGAGFSGDKGPATSAQLNHPVAIALDGAGNLYIADAGNNRVRKVYAANGVITTFAGDGTGGYTGDGEVATKAAIDDPTGLAIDSGGDVYIVSSPYGVVRKVQFGTNIISTVAGNGKDGYTGDGGPAVKAELNYPSNLALDPSGNLYISDGTSVIRRVDAKTGIITTIAGYCVKLVNGACGGAYTGDGGPGPQAALDNPVEIAYAPGNYLYIADSFNNVVRQLNLTTGIITTAAGDGDGSWERTYGTGGYYGNGGPAIKAELDTPMGVAVDSKGNLYILNYWTCIVQKIAPAATSAPPASAEQLD